MKAVLFFAAVFVVSATPFAAEQQCSKKSSNLYFGRVAQLVFKAMKDSGVTAKCDERICTLTITDFESYDEGDGCGGGTTGYGTSFKYADGKAYELAYCTGEDADEKVPKNVGASLVQVFNELGLSKTSGWRASVRLSEVECVAKVKKGSVGSVANCKITLAD